MIIIIIIRWYYCPMRTFAPFMDFLQSSMFFDLPFQFLILHLWIPVCTQFHHLFRGRPLSRLPWGLLWNSWLTFLLLSILLTWPFQFNRLVPTHGSISKAPSRCINLLLYRFSNSHLLYFPQTYCLKSTWIRLCLMYTAFPELVLHQPVSDCCNYVCTATLPY
jgi:hypothetical protein